MSETDPGSKGPGSFFYPILCIGNLQRMLTFCFSFSCNLFRSFSGGETKEVKIKKFHGYCMK